MPAVRKPSEVIKASGAVRKNPARFVGRSNPKTRMLGVPSAWMSEKQTATWAGFKDEIPWLTESDRALVEIACVIRTRLIDGQDVGVNALNLLRQAVSQMGGSPADRSKVSVPDDDKDDVDPAAKYFN